MHRRGSSKCLFLILFYYYYPNNFMAAVCHRLVLSEQSTVCVCVLVCGWRILLVVQKQGRWLLVGFRMLSVLCMTDAVAGDNTGHATCMWLHAAPMTESCVC
jgi:hypothetical protein